MPHLEHYWGTVLSCDTHVLLPQHLVVQVVEATIAASRLSGYCTRAIKVATALIERAPSHLGLALAHRKSRVLRARGDYHEADSLVKSTLVKHQASGDIRTHCYRGYLLLSLAENQILHEDFNSASAYTQQWEANGNSLLEIYTVWMKVAMIGRIFRYQGRFSEAAEVLQICLKPVSEMARTHVMHQIADTYCELGCTTEVKELLKEDIQSLQRNDGSISKSLRSLMLPMAEANLVEGNLKEARRLFEQVCDAIHQLERQEISDQLAHIRAMLGLVRLEIREESWEAAQAMIHRASVMILRYPTFTPTSFYTGVLVLFSGLVHARLGQVGAGVQAIMSARNYDPGPRHFIPGIGTYVLEGLRKDIDEVCRNVDQI